MRWFSCVLSILFFSPLVSANELETDPQVVYGGTYKIVLLSSENAVIVQGEIMLDVHDPKNITGTWDLGLEQSVNRLNREVVSAGVEVWQAPGSGRKEGSSKWPEPIRKICGTE